MHVRHEPMLRYLNRLFPTARLYGPYNHAGRHYFQLMWRDRSLRYGLMPVLEALPWEAIDPHSYGRYRKMKETYGLGDAPSYALPSIKFWPHPDDVPSAERTLIGDAGTPGESPGGREGFSDDDQPPVAGEGNLAVDGPAENKRGLN
jgi:hypothetical protein